MASAFVFFGLGQDSRFIWLHVTQLQRRKEVRKRCYEDRIDDRDKQGELNMPVVADVTIKPCNVWRQRSAGIRNCRKEVGREFS